MVKGTTEKRKRKKERRLCSRKAANAVIRVVQFGDTVGEDSPDEGPD